MACIHRPQIRVKMRSSARFAVAGISCAIFLLGPMSVIADGTSAAPAFGAVGNRANAPRRLEEGNVTAIFNNTTDEEVIVAQHNIFDRSDSEQIPILDARQGDSGKGGGGSSSSKGSKGSGSDSGGKGSTSKTSKGVGSASASNTGTTGDSKSKKSSGGDTKKAGRTKSSSSSKSDDESDDGDKKASSSSRSSAKTDLSSSKDKSSNSKKKKKKKTNSQRMCNKKSEKACRNSCIDKRCGPSDDDGHDECAKRCRYKCCSDPHGDADDEDEDADDERSCNTSKEKSCRNKCFHRKMCRDDECKRQCRRDCCVGGRVGGGGSSSRDGKKKEKKNKSNKSKKAAAKDKGAGSDDDDGGDDEDGKGCDTDVEKQCRDTCYADSSCKDGDKKCRKTCRKGCCDIGDISIVDIMSNTQDGGAGDDSSLMTGDVPLSFRFTINTSERLTADDIMKGRGNSLKDDLEGGLKILVEGVVGETFRDDRWKKEASSRHRRRKLVVRYQSSSPPSVEGVQDVSCPSRIGGSGCKRVRAEATLELEDENENAVRQSFLSAISEAIGNGRLQSAIREFNPDSGSRGPLNDEITSQSEGGGRKLSNLAIAGIAVGALAAVVLSYLGVRAYQDRSRRQKEQRIDDSSAVDNEQPRDLADEDAYDGEHNEDQRLPPIPPPPQLPDRSSWNPRESKLAAVRRELQEEPDQYHTHTPQRGLDSKGPSLKDLVATSHTPEFTTVASYQREYDDAAPDAAESDVSSKESDAMSETSSQKFIQTAKRMAERELEHDATDFSDRPDDEQAHSQARAYRHHAQAERMGRRGRETDLID